MSNNLLRFGVFMVILVFLMNTFPAFGQTDDKDRANIGEKYKWNLADIYPTVEDWKKDKDNLKKRLKKIGEFKGQLGISGPKLKEALETLYQIRKEYIKAYVYVSMLSDQDTRESDPQGLKQEMQQLGTEFSKMSAYIDPEILSIPQEKMESLFEEEPGLETYRQVIDDIQEIISLKKGV